MFAKVMYIVGAVKLTPSISGDGRLRDESWLSNFSNLTVFTSIIAYTM